MKNLPKKQEVFIVENMSKENLLELAKLVRYHILNSTTTAGSGHPTSSLSATDLLTSILFDGYFQTDLNNPNNPDNDRLIFSKGHASPLLYALYAVAGVISTEELSTIRVFGSILEGHPTMRFAYTEAATGSLGQGLGVGAGIALAGKMDKKSYKTWVLMGDSEMAEGSVWEAMQLATHYQLDNLIGIIDVNRLGQRGATMDGWEIEKYTQKCEAFGWETLSIDGHSLDEIKVALDTITLSKNNGQPKMIVAKTIKGKGVDFLENAEGWHGKTLKPEELEKALLQLGEVNLDLVGTIN